MPKSNASSTKRFKGFKEIYLDYASATPLEVKVLKKIFQVSKQYFANPSAIHSLGVDIKKSLQKARYNIASILNAHNDEIIFTSGATESNNLAILGVINFFHNKKNIKKKFIPHIITTNIEHASVLELCKYLEKNEKVQVTYIQVESNGIVEPKKIKKALKQNTVLVSVMYANNEIGTIQPIREIAKEIRHFKKNKKKDNKFPLLHTDATQAINYLSTNVEQLGIDLMSFNAGKIYGPKGIGVLFKKRNVSLIPINHGGNQEFDMRPGTENIVSVVAMEEALLINEELKIKESKRLIKLRDYFIKRVKTINNKIILNGDLINRLPNNINITIPNIPSDLLVIELSVKGIMTSAKSACKSGDGKASHVIQAINKFSKDTDGSLRFSLGRGTTKAEIDYTIKSLRDILQKLEKWYN